MFLHAIQQLQVIFAYRINSSIRILQENTTTTRLIPCHPVQISTRHLPVTAPLSPSILHGRIRLPASLQYSRAIQHKQASSNSRRQKQHSTRQAASTQSPTVAPRASSTVLHYRILPGENRIHFQRVKYCMSMQY